MSMVLNSSISPRVVEFLQDHRNQIAGEYFDRFILPYQHHSEFNVAEQACQLLRQAGVQPFADASEGEVAYACSWVWQNDASIGDRLGQKVQYRPWRAEKLAPILAALGSKVYEFQDAQTGVVDWIVLPSNRDLKEALHYLIQDRIITNFAISDFKQIDQHRRY